MHEDKHREALKEVLEEIESALEDPEGLKKHQRRLALMIPLGIAELIEIYLHKKQVIKPGSRIKHGWLKKKDAKEYIDRQCITSLHDGNLDKMLIIAREIELERNGLAYGAPLGDETILKESIEKFFAVKEMVEHGK